MFDEDALREKLRRVEALHAGATTPGERDAAANAMGRIQQRLRLLEKEDPPIEFKFTMPDAWSRRLFVALARRYGLKPYRYQRQRYNTVMLRVSRRFVDDTLWAEFTDLDATLREGLARATDSLIANVFHQESTEAEVRPEPQMLTR